MQLAVSPQIRNLEDYLKLCLIGCKTRAASLTEAGRAYLPFLQQAFDAISDGTRLLTRTSPGSILTVGMYSTFAVRWLISRLHQFQGGHTD